MSALTLIAICGLSAFAVPTYAAPSLTVNTSNDLANNPAGTTSLREAISFANTDTVNSAITFAPSISGQTISIGSELPALANNGTVSISGPAGGVTISGPNSRIFRVSTGANATLTGLTIANANISGSGGAILNSGTLTINDSTLSNNVITSSTNGGAIYSTGALTINNSTLSGNSAGGSGGAIYSTGAVTISKSTFSGNSATNSGGAIDVTNALTIGNSTFSGNNALNGGAIRNDATNGILTLDSSTISGNTATSFGGGIFSNSAAVSGTDPTTSFTLIRNSTLSGNSGNGGGGAVYNSRGLVNIQNSTVAGNTASSGAGVLTPTSSRTRVKNTIIAANASDVDGGIGSFVSDGYNVIGNGNASAAFNASGDQVGVTAAQLKLGPLTNNGGPTQTRNLLLGSVAINMGDPGFNGAGQFDQRGTPFERVREGRLDVGALEVQVADNAPTLNNGILSASEGANFSYQLMAQDPDVGDTLTYSSTGIGLPVGVQVNSDGTVSGTPVLGSAGAVSTVYTFSVMVDDGRGGTSIGTFNLTINKKPDGVAPVLTRSNNIPKTLISAQLAVLTGMSLSGTVRDLAPGIETPSGVLRVQVQLRRTSDNTAYNGSTFTSKLTTYYTAILGSDGGNTANPRTFDRSLSFIPNDLADDTYSLVLVSLDNMGNYSGEVIPFSIANPSAARSFQRMAPKSLSGGNS